MLAILSLLGVCNLGLGAPVPASSCGFDFDALDPAGGRYFVTNYRSTPEIIWTCLVTTSLCTWVSMHPDIVGYNSKPRHRISHRFFMFLWAITAPEIMLLFAAAQWRVAHDIVRKFGRRRSFGSRLRTGFENLVVKTFGEDLARKIGIIPYDGQNDGMCFYNSSVCFRFCNSRT
jgi:hypothetical protein